MSLLQKLVESYDHMADKYAGLYIDTMREPLAPISHTLQNAQIEITINDEGEFVEAALISKKEGRTLIPVTLKSANRTIKKSPHPFAEQLEFLSGFDTDLQESYLGQLKDWDESAYGNKFTHAVYMYVAKNYIIHDLYAVKILESESKADMDKKKLQSTVYKKCLVRWKIKDVLTNEVTDTWKSKEMFQSFISYYNAIITKESKIGLCMITGKNVPLTNLHAKNIYPLQSGAKLISSNDKQEFTFRGTFVKDSEDFLTVGYEASQKAHNMLRWLLNNFGLIIGNKMYLYWCPQGKYVPSPFEDITNDEDIISDKEVLFHSIFQSDIKGLTEKDDVIIASFESLTTGRVALTYYTEVPANDFVRRIKSWRESFVPSGTSWRPSLYTITRYAYGMERNEKIDITDGNYTKHLEELLQCELFDEPFSISLKNILVTKASYPKKYKSLKNRRYLTYIAALVTRKYINDKAGKEVYTMILDVDNNDINYLMGRLLAVYEKAELDTYTAEELKCRIPNAVRYQTMYAQRPAATLIILQRKIVPYLNKLKRRKYNLYMKYQNLFHEIYEKMDGRDTGLNTKLNDAYILGYYHQKESFYQKEEKPEQIAI